MKVLITGGAGMIGRKLADRLAEQGTVAGTSVESMTLFDIVAAQPPAQAGFPIKVATGDLRDSEQTVALIEDVQFVMCSCSALVMSAAPLLGVGGSGSTLRSVHRGPTIDRGSARKRSSTGSSAVAAPAC